MNLSTRLELDAAGSDAARDADPRRPHCDWPRDCSGSRAQASGSPVAATVRLAGGPQADQRSNQTVTGFGSTQPSPVDIVTRNMKGEQRQSCHTKH